MRVLFAILVLMSCFVTPASAQQATDEPLSPEKLYAHFSNCLQGIFITADSLYKTKGEAAEIEWLKSSRKTCQESSPVTRRVALKYLEWGDTMYDDKGSTIEADKKELFRNGMTWARQALTEDSLDHMNYEIMSMSFAAVISISGLRGKAHLADSVRIYAEECIRLNPGNDRAYHILGRWHYEVSRLNWFTRMLSKVIFGVDPEGSFERAIAYFYEAIELEDIVVHHYWLGMAYLEKGEKDKALEQFRILQDIPPVQHNDGYFKKEARKIIERNRG